MKQYIVDAFTDRVFHGNQAAVCVLDAWLPEELMMDITRENNFSETAFTVKEGEKYHLRWFTPGGEIDLCGHATLATAFVLLNYYEQDVQQIVFTTMSGDLTVKRKGELFEMEFGRNGGEVRENGLVGLEVLPTAECFFLFHGRFLSVCSFYDSIQ